MELRRCRWTGWPALQRRFYTSHLLRELFLWKSTVTREHLKRSGLETWRIKTTICVLTPIYSSIHCIWFGSHNMWTTENVSHHCGLWSWMKIVRIKVYHSREDFKLWEWGEHRESFLPPAISQDDPQLFLPNWFHFKQEPENKRHLLITAEKISTHRCSGGKAWIRDCNTIWKKKKKVRMRGSLSWLVTATGCSLIPTSLKTFNLHTSQTDQPPAAIGLKWL